MSKATAARGALDGDTVHVPDVAEANRLHNKGGVGAPQADNSLRLTLVEAVHSVAGGRLEVDGHDVASLLRLGAEEGGRAEVHYLAYRDLRERGLTVRPHGEAYRVWKRGATTKDDPWFTAHPRSERDPLVVADLAAMDGDVFSVVDEDGDVTHYHLEATYPVGDVRPGELPAASGVLLDDRVLVTDPHALQAYGKEGIGSRKGDVMVLSLTEAEHLRRRGVLQVPDHLARHAEKRQHHFPRTLPVYEALRAAGVVAKTGFRFGTHLRGYPRDPDAAHAEWLLQCVAPEERLHASELSRAVRLAHGVKKTFCLAIVEEPVRFLAATWFRP